MSRFKVTETIPSHLQPFIARQYPELYTPIDHASWRFILRVARAYFAKHAHQKYLDGLKETGISSESIPKIEDMDQCLRRFGWRAVAVSGFIPPAVFMEFQSLGILPIACEMRTLEHLPYTPAPDIVHEAAGHAPILADQEYADYLRQYGEISRKAIFSSKDMLVYEAIRELSDLKENPASTAAQVDDCQRRLDEAVALNTYVSEATYLARMNWWTVEYGLVGNLGDAKIYGAGLLSSVGESFHCLSSAVRKIPLTLDCTNTSYDITRPQPQLFVTADFATLTRILHDFAATMAFKRGGIDGLAKALAAETVTTTELDSGLQISGILADFKLDAQGRPSFLRYRGPTQLAAGDQELPEQGPAYHREGFSTPIGNVRLRDGSLRPPHLLTDADLAALGFSGEGMGKLIFESGIELSARWLGRISAPSAAAATLGLRFAACTIRLGDEILYRPEWGTFDLGCGCEVRSVFGGAADRARYLEAMGGFKEIPRKPKSNLTDENRALNALYARVRAVREKSAQVSDPKAELAQVYAELEADYADDWLLRLELLELQALAGPDDTWAASARKRLLELAGTSSGKSDPMAAMIAQMIERGLALV